MPKTLKYVERCTGASHNGEAWIGYVETSKTGQTVYFNGRAFVKDSRGGAGNHSDVETWEPYWISGVKQRGTNRHWAGSGRISIESIAVDEFLELIGRDQLDSSIFDVVQPFPKADREHFRAILNEKLEREDDAV